MDAVTQESMRLLRPTVAHLESYVDALNAAGRPTTCGGRRGSAGSNSRTNRGGRRRHFSRGWRTWTPRVSRSRCPTAPSRSGCRASAAGCGTGSSRGAIGFRWQPGTTDLPPTCLGHIGYSVVPWKRRRGYAREALRLMLPQVRVSGLAFVEITTDPDNVASQRVVEANGGVLHERFTKPAQFGGQPGLRYRIAL